MAYISYDKLWRSEFYNNVSAKDRFQDISPNQLKLKVNDSCKKDEKLTTNFEPSEDSCNKQTSRRHKIIQNRGSLIIKRKRIQ